MNAASPASEASAAIAEGIARTLALARTWLSWDGQPRLAEDGERIFTPHKAIRRHVDHLIDHLAQVEALLAGAQPEPDGWHGSRVTLASDLAPFTEAELNEARQRLARLAKIYALRLNAVPLPAWDEPRGTGWTIRQIIEHVSPAWYAEQVGELGTG